MPCAASAPGLLDDRGRSPRQAALTRVNRARPVTEPQETVPNGPVEVQDGVQDGALATRQAVAQAVQKSDRNRSGDRGPRRRGRGEQGSGATVVSRVQERLRQRRSRTGEGEHRPGEERRTTTAVGVSPADDARVPGGAEIGRAVGSEHRWAEAQAGLTRDQRRGVPGPVCLTLARDGAGGAGGSCRKRASERRYHSNAEDGHIVMSRPRLDQIDGMRAP